MANFRLQHDHAFQIARELLGTVKDCLMEQEHRDCIEEFYRICLRGLERYETEAARMEKRLRPSTN
jgi:hypothetical protein